MLDPDLLAPETIVPRARKLSRRAYDQLVARGAFEDQRVELLRGQLVTMSPQGDSHATITARLAQRLIRALDDTYEVRSHSPFAASDDSEPEPDISVSRARAGFYHPTKALLLIEVAHSSLAKDRLIKTEIYAESGVPEYWVIDLRSRRVFVHTEPRDGAYQSIETARRGDVLRPELLPDFAVTVDELLVGTR